MLIGGPPNHGTAHLQLHHLTFATSLGRAPAGVLKSRAMRHELATKLFVSTACSAPPPLVLKLLLSGPFIGQRHCVTDRARGKKNCLSRSPLCHELAEKTVSHGALCVTSSRKKTASQGPLRKLVMVMVVMVMIELSGAKSKSRASRGNEHTIDMYF